jgi:TonB family protein
MIRPYVLGLVVLGLPVGLLAQEPTHPATPIELPSLPNQSVVESIGIPQQTQTRHDSVIKVNEQPPADFVEVEVPPTVVRKKEPVYPEEAMKNHVEGTVWVKIWVDEQGKVHDVRLLKSEAEILNKPAVEAARQFVFSPALIAGKPVAVWVSVPFKFRIMERESGTSGADSLYSLQAIIRNILEGKDDSMVRSAVDSGAYVVDGTDLRHLRSALEASSPRNPFLSERNRRIVFSRAFIGNDRSWAYLCVRTESSRGSNPRYHTVVFSKSYTGQWTIQHWHTCR